MLKVLHNVAVALGQSRKIEDIIKTAVAEIRLGLGLEMAGLYLYDSSTGALKADPYEELSPIFSMELPRIVHGEAPTFEKTIASKKVVAWPVEEVWNPGIRSGLEIEGFRFLAIVPLLSKTKVLGLALIGKRNDVSFSTRELETLQAIGSVIGVAIDNAKLIQELMDHREQLRALTAGIQQTREVEARRIARNLHDIAGQLLTAVHLRLEEVAEMLPPAAQEHLHVAHEQLYQAEEQLRQLSHELRSPVLDDLGFEPALNFLAQGFTARTGLEITVEGTIGERLPPQIETLLYRSVQEGLTNVAKHAQATRVLIELQRKPQAIRCIVRDDGIGFDPRAVIPWPGTGGIGLLSIRERLAELGGTLEITSAPRQGTKLHMRVPLS